MCLILVAWKVRPDCPLVVAANRDEFHERSAARAGFWIDRPEILAGRDLEASGTWMGIARNGRFAAVTNYRGGKEPRAVESRGHLVTRFLADDVAAAGYAADVAQRGTGYSGFNLLSMDGKDLWWVSNRGGTPQCLAPGVYGLGNELLDSAESAVQEGKLRLAAAVAGGLSVESLFAALLPAKIVAPVYGTRCSTVVTRSADGTLTYAERAFDTAGIEGETLRYELRIT